MGDHTQVLVRRLPEYVTLIDRLKSEAEAASQHVDFLFRGQRRDLSLLPKLARLNLKGEIEDIERLMLDEFRRNITPLTEFEPKNEWDVLSLAQHYGLPTRLLDWTFSALTGLWFAVSKPAHKDKHGVPENAVVWIFIPSLDDFRTERDTDPLSSNEITKIFRPQILSRRISAQSGAFTVHKINRGGKIVPFEKHKKYSAKLIKVVIPADSFAMIRKGLHLLGVNNSILFPDLLGLCSHLQWRYAYAADESKHSALTAPTD